MYNVLLSSLSWSSMGRRGTRWWSWHCLQVPLHLLPHQLPHHLQPHPPAQVAPGCQVCGQTCGADHESVGGTGRRHGDHEVDEDHQGALVRGGEGSRGNGGDEEIC